MQSCRVLTAGSVAGRGGLVMGDGDDRGGRPMLRGLSLGGALRDGLRVQGEAVGPASGRGRGGVVAGGRGATTLKQRAAMGAAGKGADTRTSLSRGSRRRPRAACRDAEEHRRPATTDARDSCHIHTAEGGRKREQCMMGKSGT